MAGKKGMGAKYDRDRYAVVGNKPVRVAGGMPKSASLPDVPSEVTWFSQKRRSHPKIAP